MIPCGVGLWMATAGFGACSLQIHWIHAGEEESGLPARWVSGAGLEAARARWLGLELRHKAGTSLVPGCVTHPSRGRRFPRQVSSETEHPVNLSGDTKQRNALLSGQEGGGQPQRPEHPLFLLWRHGGEVLFSGKHLQNSVLKALAPSSSVWGLSALLPGHLSSVLCQALLFPWVPPCLPQFLFQVGTKHLSSLFLLALTPVLSFKSLAFSLSLPAAVSFLQVALCFWSPSPPVLPSSPHPPGRANAGPWHEVKVLGHNMRITSVCSPSPCSMEAAEKTSLAWPFPPSPRVAVSKPGVLAPRAAELLPGS